MQHSFRHSRHLLFFWTILCVAHPLFGGMAAPLPDSWSGEGAPIFTKLNQGPRAHFQTISFFLGGVLVSTLGIRWLWNGLVSDSARLPKLTLKKSFCLTMVLGLMFLIVLIMISGARELMTPGAWERTGATYSLKTETSETP